MSTIPWIMLGFALMVTPLAADSWKPGQGPLMTAWADEVSPDKVWPEYPRPQMVRPDWLNLNGLWQFQPGKAGEEPPLGSELSQRILVPFPVESAMSGVMMRADRVWYRRTFEFDSWIEEGKRILLHFGAVDWEAAVWVNGRKMGMHRGGYDPFSFDVTDALNPSGLQEIVVGVWDPTDGGDQPRGKQVLAPHGIWYTPTTGIWQTVWLEAVPQGAYIESLHIIPRVDGSSVRISAGVAGAGRDCRLAVEASSRGRVIARSESDALSIDLRLDAPRLWSPDDPFLYDLTVYLLEEGKPVDEVGSYFGLRKVSLIKDARGVTRLALNNEPLFMIGPLDQGFWPDGLYTAPTDEALRHDLEVTKKLGFNMVRKHVKIEPPRWYYWADRLGLLVWQDMPSGNNGPVREEDEAPDGEEWALQFEDELKAMIDLLRNHPCVAMWVVFNESWGQYDTKRLTRWVKNYDPTRLVNCASGWHDRAVGDVLDLHAYPGPVSPEPEPTRAAVLGEFGGLGLPLSGHTWQDEKNWGYRNFEDRKALMRRYLQLYEEVRLLMASPGLSAAVYTQTTDVETEVNGLMTYDRAVIKLDPVIAAEACRRLHGPLPVIEEIVPASNREGRTWRFTLEDPGPDWFEPGFDDSAWREGPGGFGREGTPGAKVRTAWTGTEIWLRRIIELPEQALKDPRLFMHHDEDAAVYIDGTLLLEAKGYTTSYRLFRIDEEGRNALEAGQAVLAVHCRQTGGGQYIDAGIVDIREAK
jgi:hypothetical protein